MAYEQRDNSGVLFKNTEKGEEGANPKWPDYKGSATIDGVEYWMSAWIKDSKNGKFMSFAFKPKDGPAVKDQVGDTKLKTEGGTATTAKISAGVDFDDQIPF